jgi:thioredoxin-like negative regulator of GroEL
MEQIGKQYQILKFNVDYEVDVIAKYGVMNVPTVILVENGEEVRRFTGVKSFQQVLDFIQ